MPSRCDRPTRRPVSVRCRFAASDRGADRGRRSGIAGIDHRRGRRPHHDSHADAGRIAQRGSHRGARRLRSATATLMMFLFPDDASARENAAPAPLAERMRPRTFDEFVGQEELLAPGKPLREAIERDLLQSIILWGPPGTGKTTLARIIADTTKAKFVSFSAVLAGIKEIREVMSAAERQRRAT